MREFLSRTLRQGNWRKPQTDSPGLFSVPALLPGEHPISVSPTGFSANVVNVTIAAGANQRLNMTLRGVLSLGDLGFSPADTQGTAEAQARLDKRSHMLRVHQRLALIAPAPLFASVVTGTLAVSKATSSTDRFTHLALGSQRLAICTL